MHIAIFLFDGVTALDAVGPFESIVRLPDAKITFVSGKIGPVRTGDGFLSLNASADFASVPQADVLIVPGGHPTGLRAALGNQELHQWIQTVDAKSRWTCSVCSGSLILGAAGVLAGRRASTNFRAKEYLARFKVEYSEDRVTIDGKYITSAGVSAGIDMGLMLCEKLAGRELAEAIELSMQYSPQPPFGTGDYKSSATPRRLELIEKILRN